MFLANQAHRRGLSAVLKNDLGQIKALLPYFDFALNEQCHQYDECGRLRPFVNAGKAVFGVEYKLDKPRVLPRRERRELQLPEEEALAARVALALPSRLIRARGAADVVISTHSLHNHAYGG